MMLLSRFRSFKTFIPIFVLWITCYLFVADFCRGHKDREEEDRAVRVHVASEQKISRVRIESLWCTSRGGKLRLCIFNRHTQLFEKEIWNTTTKIDLPVNFELIVMQWQHTTKFCVELEGLKVEAGGPCGLVALQFVGGSFKVQGSSNLLVDPRCFIKVNGALYKDPSIKYLPA